MFIFMKKNDNDCHVLIDKSTRAETDVDHFAI